MCGIVAVIPRPSDRPAPVLRDLLGTLDDADARLEALIAQPTAEGLNDVRAVVAAAEHALRGAQGTLALIADHFGFAALEHRAASLTANVTALDARLDTNVAVGREIEALSAELIALKDALWALARDRLRTARAVEGLAGVSSHAPSAIEAFHSIQLALSALDRMEVHGRDSAGLHVLVTGHGLDFSDPTIFRLVSERSTDPLFTSGSVRVADGHLAFVYKTAAEIGELGDNTARLREAITNDDLLRLAVQVETAKAVVVAHTRWASVGIISEANAHPLNQEELDVSGSDYVAAALNGDVDNYADLKALESLHFPAEITTDAKVIPALVSRRITNGAEPIEAFRATVAGFEGSVAIAATVASDPGRVLLAQRGSGQALYIGIADDAYVIASEPYGVVEECDHYLRLDGETMLVPGEPGTQGQIAAISAETGIERWCYDGSALPVSESEFKQPEITTRDVDRGDAPHYLLKEIYEAPASFHKTLRGRLVEVDGRMEVRLPPESLPTDIIERLRAGTLRRVIVTGQGTAAIAGQGIALALRRTLAGRSLSVEAISATELSGFELLTDMSDTLVLAISQSGTTADTNRTVDVVRARGAAVIGIVNRRQSDLVDKSDGVLYTSDGRDVEMSVASTKAFYAMIAAGFLLAFAIAAELGPNSVADGIVQHDVLVALRELPNAMREVLERRPAIALAAQRHSLLAPFVGSGRQRHQPGRGRGDPDQALRALLQVDLVRHHRRQEAHRPLGGTDDRRVRRGIARVQRRRRRQGDRHLSSAQVGTDRDRGRGRRALPRRARDAERPCRASRSLVRAVHDGGPSVRLRVRARHRRDRTPAA